MENEASKIPNNINSAFWYPLDNAAKIYPAIISEQLTGVFRISAVLKNRIKIKHLLEAVEILKDSFPYFKVKLKKGAFWYYLEQYDFPIHLEPDDKPPCRSFLPNRIMFRIMVVGNRISVEFSHILTDGAGALAFLKTLLIEYFRSDTKFQKEHLKRIPSKDHVDSEESEDAFNRHFKEEIPPKIGQSKAFHLPFYLGTEPIYQQIHAQIKVEEIKNRAAELGVSITVYLVSIYLFILQEIFQELPKIRKYRKSKSIRIQVPINLRNFYPSKTMRNFSLFLLPHIDLRLGYYSFEEIVKTVYHQMALETDPKFINRIISRNVGSEKKFYIRGIPLFLKSLVLRYKYNSLGPRQYSGVLTNLGNVTLPEDIGKYVDHFIFLPPPPHKRFKVSCGVIGYGDKIVLSFGNISCSNELERKFLKFLSSEGIIAKLIMH